MKIKYIVLTVIVVAVSFIGYSYYQSNKNNDKYIEFEKQAQNDIKNNKKKYYHFGFVPMNKQNDLYDVLEKIMFKSSIWTALLFQNWFIIIM